jgi:microcystin-dependent protein
MANYEATRYDYDGANLTGLELVPTATIVPWSAASIPSGFLECNGQAVSRTTYAALFAIVSTTYGVGDGSSTFNVPDLQDRVPVSKSPNKALASTGGANTVTKTGNVGGSTANATLSTPQLASHSHPGGGNAAPNSVKGQVQYNENFQPGFSSGNTSNTGSGGAHSHNLSANFSGDATSVVQPYLTVVYIIKT